MQFWFIVWSMIEHNQAGFLGSRPFPTAARVLSILGLKMCQKISDCQVKSIVK